MWQRSDAQAAAAKEPGARGLLDKIEQALRARGIEEGEPNPAQPPAPAPAPAPPTFSGDEGAALQQLSQLSGMLAPPLGGMLSKLLEHWRANAGASAAAAKELEALRAERQGAAALEGELAALRAERQAAKVLEEEVAELRADREVTESLQREVKTLRAENDVRAPSPTRPLARWCRGEEPQLRAVAAVVRN